MLLTSRTPLRVSFFGGGTDYPEYFRRARSAVLGMAIDKYVYVSVLRLANVLDYYYRLSYSRIETVHDLQDIEHPVVREILRYYEIEESLDISLMSDLPARSGLGSSSTFTVGFLNLVSALKGYKLTKLDLARQAIFVERELLGENVGVQDQHHAAFGGINYFEFDGARTRISPVPMTSLCLKELTSSLFLMHTGMTRFASSVLDEQMEKTRSGSLDQDLSHLVAITDQAMEALTSDDPERMLLDFGALLHEGWELKKRFSSRITNSSIDELYDAGRQAGALGGKLCGAGSGGFLLMLVPPERQAGFREMLKDVSIIPVGLDTLGSTVLTG